MIRSVTASPPPSGKPQNPRKLSMALDTVVCAATAIWLLAAALRPAPDGTFLNAGLSLAAATALLATAALIIRRAAAAPLVALASLLLLSLIAAITVLHTLDGGTDARQAAQTRDIIRTLVPLAFFGWITRDLFIARREGILA